MFDWLIDWLIDLKFLGILDITEETVEKNRIESTLILDIENKKITGEINKELKKKDFKQFWKEPITAEQLLEIDSHVETSEEIEELSNQEIYDLAMHKEEEEDEIETRASEEIISNEDALVSIDKLFKYFEEKEDFNEDDFNALIKIKNKVEKNIENKLTQKSITEVFSKISVK
jgi:hypothetical protein